MGCNFEKNSPILKRIIDGLKKHLTFENNFTHTSQNILINKSMDAKAINKWRQANKRLFYQFPSEWVAFSPENGILAHNPSRKMVAETLLEAGYSRLDFIMEYIHPYEVVRPKKLF